MFLVFKMTVLLLMFKLKLLFRDWGRDADESFCSLCSAAESYLWLMAELLRLRGSSRRQLERLSFRTDWSTLVYHQ